MNDTKTHTLRTASEIFNVEVQCNIESSNDIPRLEEIIRDGNRCRRSSLRVAKYASCATKRAAAIARAEAFQAKAACAAARLESFND